MAQRWQIAGSIVETVEMDIDQAINTVTGQGLDDVTDDELGDPELCGACGALVVAAARHARHHAAVAIVGRYARDAITQLDGEQS